MKKRWIFSAMVVWGGLLLSGVLYAHATNPGKACEEQSSRALSSEHGTEWICAYEAQRAEAEYYRGRAGQLERRAGRPEPKTRVKVVCRPLTGGDAMIVRYCPL